MDAVKSVTGYNIAEGLVLGECISKIFVLVLNAIDAGMTLQGVNIVVQYGNLGLVGHVNEH